LIYCQSVTFVANLIIKKLKIQRDKIKLKFRGFLKVTIFYKKGMKESEKGEHAW